MKKIFLLIATLIATNLSLFAQEQPNKAAYIIPDIGAPGMNIYIELLAHVDSIGAFGNVAFINDSSLYLTTANADDAWKIQFSPLYVSWNGRLITAQAFIHPNLNPKSWHWSEGLSIPIALVQNGVVVNAFNFYVVQPFHLGDISGLTDSVFGNYKDGGKLGLRSPRGAMLIDSAILGNKRYTVSTIDCDPMMDGEQGYLPFTLIAIGDIKGDGATISIDASNQDGGAGGGGGGGSFYDELLENTGTYGKNHPMFRGGNGFTGGGIGGINISMLNSNGGNFSSIGGGKASGSNDKNTTSKFDASNPSYSGYSINGVKGAKKGAYEAAGGGTGHPFGTSGEGCPDGNGDNKTGGYGAGSGGKQKTSGGHGTYAFGSATPIQLEGTVHGNGFIVPLAGGSGGASGNPEGIYSWSGYGGGGGGAIAITACNIYLNGITANGSGGGTASNSNYSGGYGSGGAIIANAKIGMDIDTIATMNGNKETNTEAGEGYSRFAGRQLNDFMNIVCSKNDNVSATATDTTKTINRDVATTLRGNTLGTTKLYVKNETGAWRFLDSVTGDIYGDWSYNILPTFWNASTDTIYYLYAVDEVINPNNSDYTAIPNYILAQSAANVLILESDKQPHIYLCNEFPIDTLILCGDTSIIAAVQQICNKGEANLLLDSIEYSLVWNNTWFQKDSLKPGDTNDIVIVYNIPSNVETGIYYDTIKIYHNDTARQNPWIIYVTIPVEKLELVINPTSITVPSLWFAAPEKDTIIKLINNFNVPINFTNIICNSSRINYTFQPTTGTVPANSSINILVKYIPRTNATDGSYIDTVVVTTPCGIVNNCYFVGRLLKDSIVYQDGSIDLGKIAKCGTATLPKDLTMGVTTGASIIDSVSIYGINANYFRFFTTNPLPIEWLPSDIFYYTVSANEIGNNNIYYGNYYATMEIHTYSKDSPADQKVFRFILSYQVVPALVANPNPADLGGIAVGTNSNFSIELEYQISNFLIPHSITKAYLKDGSVFSIDNSNLIGKTFNQENEKINANLSYNLTTAGEYYDTLVVVIPFENCDDSLFVPLHIKGVAGKAINPIVVSLGTITHCDTTSWTEYSSPNESQKGIVDSIISIIDATGTNADMFDWSFSKTTMPVEIDRGDGWWINFKVKSEENTPLGMKRAEVQLIEILPSGDTVVNVYQLSVEVVEGVVANPLSLNFGDINSADSPSINAIIVNRSNTIVEIISAELKDGTNFEITKSFNFNFLLGNNEDSSTITAKPQQIGIVKDTIIVVIQYPLCTDTVWIPIEANVNETKKNNFTITASKNIMVSPTATNYELPIYISSNAELIEELTIDTLILQIDRTLFNPNSSSNGQINSQIVYGNVEIVLTNIKVAAMTANKDIVLLNVIGNVMLGNKDSSVIELNYVAFKNSDLQKVGSISKVNGALTIAICTEGDDRLIEIGKPPIISTVPNPASTSIQVNCTTVENGKHYIEIIDMNTSATILKEWEVKSGNSTDFSFTIPLDNFSNGSYILRLNAPNQSSSTILIIAK